ncbi:MAG TPA: response regulator transcription factor [Nitrolancea sp.]|nr:response regulator transcription factor [Nitrolancea sp.]
MRIVVVNPDAIMAKLMRFVLTEAGHEAVLARTGEEGLRAIVGRETDGVLLAIDLPDVSGYVVCKELRAKQYVGPVIFVSERRNTHDKLKAFDHGADDYIIEPFDPQELVARVEVVARRCTRHDRQPLATILKAGDAELQISELAFQVTGRPRVLLTPTEMRLLECLMRNVGITIGRERLIERTWGYDYLGDSNRVEVYVARLRKKIERNPSQPEYLVTIRGIGYAFRIPEGTSDVFPVEPLNETVDGQVRRLLEDALSGT